MGEAVSSGHWKAADYAGAGAFVPALGQGALDLLDPKGGERILDVGCGDGALTVRIAEAGADVVGVDANRDLLEVASDRGIATVLSRAKDMAFDAPFDAAFSNAALHWMGDRHDEVASRIFVALKPGGRFAGEMGGHRNIAGLLGALEAEARKRGYVACESAANWYPTVAEFSQVYSDAGFAGIEAELIDRTTQLGAEGVPGWIRTFRSGWLDTIGMPAAERNEFSTAVAERWGRGEADYVRLRFIMRKP